MRVVIRQEAGGKIMMVSSSLGAVTGDVEAVST